MIELFEQDIKFNDRHSSKGNQLKWENNGIWYKADFNGYEGLSEYVISRLLEHSTLNAGEFIRYDLEEIRYKDNVYNGAGSRDFLSDGWQIITLERLYKQHFGQSLHTAIWHTEGTKERFELLCSGIRRITNLDNFGEYLAKMITIDAFFLNEDRHTHNIAVLMNDNGEYKLCPIFDNGAGLLSDTAMDYPMGSDIYQMIDTVKAKPVCDSFIEQLNAVEELFGKQIRFTFTKKDVDDILKGAGIYDNKILERVRTVIYEQMRRYTYLMN